ncbi:hypothetical protein [Massilia sp. Leaf139]|uniref:hypothetical protein n=1 Tax=Massilia sp. Leaf139 TaxID=1736272 RepID=UPI0012E981AB|nr:hypothetical protein [Massilia sp. Leaf139]
MDELFRADETLSVKRSTSHHMKVENMKDVKVDVRVNVGVDAASVAMLFASAAWALFLYKEHKQAKLTADAQGRTVSA